MNNYDDYDDSKNSIDLIYELAKEKLHRQESKWDAIDQKNYFALAVFGIILAVLTAFNITEDSSQYSTWIKGLLVVELAFIFCGILCNTCSLALKKIKEGPDISAFTKGTKKNPSYLRTDPVKTKLVLLSIFDAAIMHNKKALDKKLSLLKTSYFFLLPGSMILLFPFVIINYFMGG